MDPAASGGDSADAADAMVTPPPRRSKKGGAATSRGSGGGVGVGFTGGGAAMPPSPFHVVRSKLKMREHSEKDSLEAGELKPGTKVLVLERDVLPDGTQRACVADARDADGGSPIALGWITTLRQDGSENLVPMDDPIVHSIIASAGAAARATGRISPSRDGGSPGRERSPGRGDKSPSRDRAGTDSQVFVVGKLLKVREKPELESSEAGVVEKEALVRVLDRRELADGTRRAKIAMHNAEMTPIGWVSLEGKDGKENLIVEWRGRRPMPFDGD